VKESGLLPVIFAGLKMSSVQQDLFLAKLGLVHKAMQAIQKDIEEEGK
jgi:hypothetical protein